jgi:hypothetical protein
MRDLINLVSEASHDEATMAQVIYAAMSPMQRYRLTDKLVGLRRAAGEPAHLVGWEAKDAANLDYIAAHLDEFDHVLNPPADTRDLGDGGIHRLY